MDGLNWTVIQACVRSHIAQTIKGLGKTPSWVQGPLREFPATVPRHIAVNGQLGKPVQKYKCSVTRGRSCWVFAVKQGGMTLHEDSHINNTIAAPPPPPPPPPTRHTDCTCHHSQKHNEPDVKDRILAQSVVLGLSVHSVAGSILLWGHFPVEGIFPFELTLVETPFPPKLFRMRV